MPHHLDPSTIPGLVSLAGVFYRAVESQHRAFALTGSRNAGRYSSPEQPTLYLSVSPEGIEAAMIAHERPDTPPREVLAFEVQADRIFDLRDEHRCSAVGINPAEAAAPWQDIVAKGGEPPSWRVAERLRSLGANGLIDPSRKAPGLWHLVLFCWNQQNGPSLRLA